MEQIRIAFFDTKPYDIEFFEKINNEKHHFLIKFFENKLTPDTVSLAKGYPVVCAFVNDILNKEVIDTIIKNGTKLVALRSAGYNNVDLKTTFENIHVVRVPAYSPYAVAEHAVAMILTLNRNTHRAYYRIKEGNFSINGLMGFDMHEKTVGVIGTGKIGKIFARIMKGFEMNVLLYDVYPDDDFARKNNLKYVDLTTLYSESDILSLHCPLTSETYHLINSESIKKMKDDVMIINTGRGRLIDTRALISALKTKKIGAAGLDVYEEESEYFFEDFSSKVLGDDVLARLLTFPNVLITSHQGFFTAEALQNIAATTLNNIEDFFSGKPLQNEICYQCDKEPCMKKVTGRCF